MSLGGDKNVNVHVDRRELPWYAPTMSHLDPRTVQFETEVHRVLDLKSPELNCLQFSYLEVMSNSWGVSLSILT